LQHISIPPVRPFVRPAVRPSTCVSVRPSICSLCLPVHMSTRPSVRRPVRPSCPLVQPPIRPSVRLSVCPSARPSVCLSVRLSVCLYGQGQGLGRSLSMEGLALRLVLLGSSFRKFLRQRHWAFLLLALPTTGLASWKLTRDATYADVARNFFATKCIAWFRFSALIARA
jgi:hypothetical protein